MTGVALWLRGTALLGVLAAVLDPGCVSEQRAPVRLVVGASMEETATRALERVVREAGFELSADAGPRSIRVAAGLPREIVAAARESPIALAVREVVRPHVDRLGAPAAPVVGLAMTLRAHVAGVPAGDTALTVWVRDALSGRVVGNARVSLPADEARGDDGTADGQWVSVGLLPLAAGPWRLCVGVGVADAQPDLAACERIDLTVASATLAVHVFEARPSWAARFARLALTRSDDLDVSSTVRMAPAVAVQGRPRESAAAAAAERRDGGTDVTLVGGLDALTTADVARLVRQVTAEGQTVVLLADGPLPARRLGALWPSRAAVPVRTRTTPALIAIGPHHWSAREWLAPDVVATDATPLAYLAASPAIPVVWGRALGTGRVVLVAALDTWRWRGDEARGHDEAWQALVLSLAGLHRRDGLRAWRISSGPHDDVYVSRPFGTADGEAPEIGAGGIRHRMIRADGAWRGVVSVPSDAVPADLTVSMRDASVAADASRRMAGPLTAPAGWGDVERVVGAAGGEVVIAEALGSALESAAAQRIVEGPRWHLTRRWWFAACIIAALGTEWWIRRRAFMR